MEGGLPFSKYRPFVQTDQNFGPLDRQGLHSSQAMKMFQKTGFWPSLAFKIEGWPRLEKGKGPLIGV